jgi:DNA-binding GntR family transcriptional regulator
MGEAVQRCVVEIRSLILRGALFPGEHIRQVALAERLGVSRIPVREALKTLQAEGVVKHSPNAGFTVARFEERHLVQIYLMRTLLETELLRTLPVPTPEIMAELRSVNDAFTSAARAGAIDELIAVNREFHFRIFELSPLELIRAEVIKLWDMSEFYRSLYAYEAAARDRAIHDHQALLAAIEAGDTDGLLDAMDAHREASRAQVLGIIRRFSPMGSGSGTDGDRRR